MSSGGRPETRIQILEAARALFEELGYYGAGLEAVAKKAGVSRQAIYLHFPSKAELLTALHLHVFDTDVVPALRRHPITDAMSAFDVLDATIAADVEIVARVWRIHESLTVDRHQVPATFFIPAVSALLHPEQIPSILRSGRHEIAVHGWIHESLTVARRQHPEVDQTLIPREEEHYEGLLDVGRRLERDGALPPTMPVGLFADMLWGLLNIGTYRNLVVERGWSPEQYKCWVRDTIRLQIAAA